MDFHDFPRFLGNLDVDLKHHQSIDGPTLLPESVPPMRRRHPDSFVEGCPRQKTRKTQPSATFGLAEVRSGALIGTAILLHLILERLCATRTITS